MHFKLILIIDGWGIYCKIALGWLPLDHICDKSTSVQVMAWCRLPKPMLTQIYVAIYHNELTHWPLEQGSHSFFWIKTKDFSRTFQDQTRCFEDLYRKFHNADMLKIHFLNREICPSQLFRKAHSIALNDFAWLWIKLAKHIYPSIWVAYKTGPIISYNQTLIFQLAK